LAGVTKRKCPASINVASRTSTSTFTNPTMTSRTERFERKSAPQGPKPTRQDTKLILRFAPEEEAVGHI